MNKVAIRYAKASLSLAQEQAKGAQILAQFKQVTSVISGNKDLQHVILDKSLSESQKTNVLLAVFKDCDLIVSNLIKVLLKNKRIAVLNDVAKAYIDLDNKLNGIEHALVTTAVALDAALEEKVLEKITSLIGQKQVVIENQIDSDIIGGFIFRVGDLQYDASILNQLTKIKRELHN